jgi:hypothetical protein
MVVKICYSERAEQRTPNAPTIIESPGADPTTCSFFHNVAAWHCIIFLSEKYAQIRWREFSTYYPACQ